MAVAGGFDLHRGQLTFDYVDTGTGESRRGRICPADRESLREWLRRFDGVPDVEFAQPLLRAGLLRHHNSQDAHGGREAPRLPQKSSDTREIGACGTFGGNRQGPCLLIFSLPASALGN